MPSFAAFRLADADDVSRDPGRVANEGLARMY